MSGDKNWSLIVSVSIHDGQQDKMSNETVHMMTIPENVNTEEAITLKRNLIIEIARQFGLDVYKVEHPREVH